MKRIIAFLLALLMVFCPMNFGAVENYATPTDLDPAIVDVIDNPPGEEPGEEQ